MDKYLLEFIANNSVTMYVLYTVLKGIALVTPNVTDNKIVTLIAEIYNAIKSGRTPNQIPIKEETV